MAVVTYTLFFNKGHPIRDSTEKILQNKGQYTMSSTELNENKGQWKCLVFFFQITYFKNTELNILSYSN